MNRTSTLTRTAARIIAGTRAAAPGRTAVAGAATAAAAAAAMMITCGGAAMAATPAPAAAAPRAAAAQLNCAASPHACGYPDATSAGVPAAAQLRSVPAQVSSGPGWKYDPRGWVEVYGNGAVLTGLSIHANLDITASNVTVNNVSVQVSGQGFGISLRHTSNVTIENTSVYSPDASGPGRLQVAIKDIYADSSGTVLDADNIWHASTGIQISEGTIKNSYVHDLAHTGADHVNGIASDAGDHAGLTITHNTILNPVDQTDAIALFEDFGQQFDATVTGNLLAGGGYTIYGGANAGKWTPANITITGNRFATIYYPRGGYFGPAANVSTGTNGNTWSGNTWDSTGQPVNM